MASRVFYKASVEGDLKRSDRPTAARILNKIEKTLSATPNKGEPLSGEFHGLFKYRIGDYRVIYSRTHEGILIMRINHRRESYR